MYIFFKFGWLLNRLIFFFFFAKYKEKILASEGGLVTTLTYKWSRHWQAPYGRVVITWIPNSCMTSFAKEYIILSKITQVTGPKSEFLLYSTNISRKSGFVTDLYEMTMSLVKSKVRGWSFGRPSEMDSKWRVGKWVESSCSWVRRQNGCARCSGK